MTTIVDLGKLRFYWAGNYDPVTEYELNDVVRYGGNVYVYISVVKTIGNEPTDPIYWALMVEGINFIGEWNALTQYYIGDAVAYGSTVYVSLQDNINQQPDTHPAIWSQFVEGIQYEGVYNPLTTYQANDVVTYGPTAYIAKQTTSNNLPTNTTYWNTFVQGISPEGVYNNATAYVPGQIVAYGANLYSCIANTTGNIPTNTTYWELFIDTIRTRGDWTTATLYYINDIVVYGGNTYICLVQATSGVFATDLAAGKWQVFNGGVRWRGDWAPSTPYLENDIAFSGLSTYIANSDFTSSSVDFAADFALGRWSFFAKGAADILPPYTTANAGQSLTVNAIGSIDWINASGSTDVFYVSPDGDDANPGTSLALPFASIQAAVAAASAGNATIFVKTGTYSEALLPIIVPPNTAIVGDNQRTVNVQPAAGLAADGVTPNNQATMFLMSNASILNKMTFKGMTGWVPGGTPEDIRTSTPKGIIVALNPASPVTTKSPYILECSAIASGAIGALVDGSAQASGYKSMLFHGYTVITDNGVGFWARSGGRAEIVSCFTYYAYFGYSSSGGGIIRALNGNNSYGTWGAASFGFSAAEVPITGALYGKQLTASIAPILTGFAAGSTITGVSSGATGIVTNLQSSAAKVYYTQTSVANFIDGETVNDGLGNTIVIDVGGVSNQKGFLLVANGFSVSPQPGASIQIAGDSSSYVVQSVSGTYVNSSSVMSLALAQEKLTPSAPGAVVTIRYGYSQIRLTGHDFLNIGTGGVTTTNYPGIPTQPPAQGQEVNEDLPGRVYYVSTDQDGNFRVGEYFRVDQATGTATLNANAFNLAGLTSLRLGSIGAQLGETINEFSSDVTLGGNSNQAVPTEFAVKGYVDNRVPQALPTSVGNTGKYLASSGSTVSWQTLESFPTQTYANGEVLFTDGTAPYWDSFTQISGQNTFSFVNGASFPSTAYTATSQVNASPTFTWNVDFGNTLPPGITAISINSSGTLTMTGTFTTNGSYNLSVVATDQRGLIGRLQVRIVVAATNVIPVFTTAGSTVTNSVGPSQVANITSFQATNTGGGIVYAIVSGGYPSWLTFNTTTGAFTGTAPSVEVPKQNYILTISATAGGVTVLKTFRWNFGVFVPQGQALFGTNTGTGTFSWTAPAGVTSVSVVAIGGGANSATGSSSYGAGGGAGLGYKNNITVVPGNTYTVQVGAPGSNRSYGSVGLLGGNSFFINTSTVAGYGGGHFSYGGTGGPNANGTTGGGWFGDGGGAGGRVDSSYQGGGGGGGGYAGAGANSGGYAPAGGGGGGALNYSSTYGYSGGGGVGLLGQGPSGLSGLTSSTPSGGGPGGAGGAGSWNGPAGGTATWSTVGNTPNAGADNNLGRGCRGMLGENPYNSTGEGSNSPLYGGTYGGGGGGAGDGWPNAAGIGGQGGVRIIWGLNRSFPATNTADVTPT